MSAVGNWTLHYSWGCTGGYVQTPMTFNANGTFAVGALTGKFAENAGKIIFRFDSNNSVYGGDEVSNAMVGISSTFAGLNGCWYAIRVGSTLQAAHEAKPEHDASGQKTK